jgi:hypothetical protein
MTIDEALQEFTAALDRTQFDLDLYQGHVEDGGEETHAEKAAELRDTLRQLAEAATGAARALDGVK